MSEGYHGNPTCCCDCQSFSDNFNRDDTGVGTGWGPLWDHSNGTGNISSNTAKLDSGYMVFEQELPDKEGSALVDIAVVNPQDGDIYDIYLAWKSITEFLGARFEVDGGNSKWIQQISSMGISGTSDVWFKDDVELISGCGTFQEEFVGAKDFSVSYDREVLRIGGTSPEDPHYELWGCYEVTWTPANKVVLAHGGGPRSIFFDNFAISDHFVHNSVCPFYGCVCQAT